MRTHRHPTLALVALLLTSCAPAPTRIALTIEYDDAWAIGLMEIRGHSGEAERDVRLPAQHSLEIWVPESWAGQETRIRVRGLHGSNDAIATGTGTVVPVLGATTPLTITLHRVACGAWCTEGETRCFGDAVAACAQLDLDPCLEWAPSVPCSPDAPFCSLGQCRAQCIDECAENEARCDGPNGYQICGNFDGDSCREWSTTTTCNEGQTCDSGTCTLGCRNQCSAGATQCSGSSIVSCGDLNDDGCTEWGPTARCAAGTCEGNRCVEACSNECEADECSGNVFHECGQFDDDSCLDRSPGLSCTPADLCLDGMCHRAGCTSIARACDRPPPQTCVSTNTLRVYDAVGECTAGDCNYTSRDISCPNCPSCDACAGVTCNMPPVATCANASTRRTFASTGICEAGSCDYSYTDTPCNNPPTATCANSTTTRTYASSGTCSSGACSYSAIDTACNRPPAASCINGSTLRTYMSTGNCSSGACSYPALDTSCACINGTCACSPDRYETNDTIDAASMLEPLSDQPDSHAIYSDMSLHDENDVDWLRFVIHDGFDLKSPQIHVTLDGLATGTVYDLTAFFVCDAANDNSMCVEGTHTTEVGSGCTASGSTAEVNIVTQCGAITSNAAGTLYVRVRAITWSEPCGSYQLTIDVS